MGFFKVEIKNQVPRRKEGAPRLGLTREIPEKGQNPSFVMSEPFGYDDEVTQDAIVVPHTLATAKTDLASVPSWLGWLAAKTGRNLPAALLHDVLIVKGPGEVNHWVGSVGGDQFSKATEPYDAHQADRMFRHAMRDVGVSRFRRWIIWSGVSVGTHAKAMMSSLRRVVPALRLLVLAVLGLLVGLWFLPNVVLDLADKQWWWFGRDLLGTTEGSVWSEAFEWAGFLGGSTLVAMLALTDREHPEGSQAGAIVVGAAVLFGWLSVLSGLIALAFGLSARIVEVVIGRAEIDQSPDDAVAPAGGYAVFSAKTRMAEQHTAQWVRQEADGSWSEIEGAQSSELLVDVGPDLDGAQFKLEVRDEEGQKVAESRSAQLRVELL